MLNMSCFYVYLVSDEFKLPYFLQNVGIIFVGKNKMENLQFDCSTVEYCTGEWWKYKCNTICRLRSWNYSISLVLKLRKFFRKIIFNSLFSKIFLSTIRFWAKLLQEIWYNMSLMEDELDVVLWEIPDSQSIFVLTDKKV